MSKTQRGKHDGTGPYKDSAQSQTSDVGKRQESGEPCPKKKKTGILPEHHSAPFGSFMEKRSKL